MSRLSDDVHITLKAKSTSEDLTIRLDAGADDCKTKQFPEDEGIQENATTEMIKQATE